MDIFDKMKDHWPSAAVAQTSVGDFTGGLINPRTLANLNSLGQGPNGKYRLGRTVFYDIDFFVVWMRDRFNQTSNDTGCGSNERT